MNIRKNLIIFNNIFSLNQLIKLTSQRIFLPFYHTISDERLPHISNLYPLRNRKLFEEDLDYLCKYFEPISIDDLYSIINENKPIPKPVFHLTFDDGLKEVYFNIAPILERKGIPATIFINTDFVDNKALFYRYKVSLLIENIRFINRYTKEIAKTLAIDTQDNKAIIAELLSINYNDISKIDSLAKILNINFEKYLLEFKPYLTYNQVNDLLKRGFNIGSHSASHPFFKDIDEKERKIQVNESFMYIEKNFNVQKRYFSFPFSDEGIEIPFFQWLYENQRCNLSFGISGLKSDFTKFHLHRTPFESSTQKAKDIVKSEYFYYLVKSFFNKNKITRQ
ncbi:MAG TPA: polysaccharide deacetylase family protein [Saprospiraceae bacterium]|nr:polysaccharide deacetylase family protein [Saprospiraceae bacterium]